MKMIYKNSRVLSTLFILVLFSVTLAECLGIEFSQYLDRIDQIVKTRKERPKSIYAAQRKLLLEHQGDIRALTLKKGNADDTLYNVRRNAFDGGVVKYQLIKQWEINTGVSWPKYNCKDCCRKKGSCYHRYFEAHHVIPLGYNGANEWWNIFPLTIEQHTGSTGIHASKEAKTCFPKVKK
jgi:5-methylcytosine-specific restriction endonuclease McrA